MCVCCHSNQHYFGLFDPLHSTSILLLLYFLAYLLCQSQHNIKMVPGDERNSVKNNVHSGTILSGEQLQILSFTGSYASSFLLTAHGGLKGTSKPVLYRTLLNENEMHRPSSAGATQLTQEKLQRLIYHMSFQYTTATKVNFSLFPPFHCRRILNFYRFLTIHTYRYFLHALYIGRASATCNWVFEEKC